MQKARTRKNKREKSERGAERRRRRTNIRASVAQAQSSSPRLVAPSSGVSRPFKRCSTLQPAPSSPADCRRVNSFLASARSSLVSREPDKPSIAQHVRLCVPGHAGASGPHQQARVDAFRCAWEGRASETATAPSSPAQSVAGTAASKQRQSESQERGKARPSGASWLASTTPRTPAEMRARRWGRRLLANGDSQRCYRACCCFTHSSALTRRRPDPPAKRFSRPMPRPLRSTILITRRRSRRCCRLQSR
jgi:hypothetical protein